jgi:ATP-dependent DNA helicase RecQ
LLKNHGFKSRLIQSNDGFNLFNLLELRFFIEQLQSDEAQVVVSDETWEKAKSRLTQYFKRSSMLEVARKVISEFEATNKKKKYLSDFELFAKESKLEDFYFENGDIIFVSTIHKAKGKEFDNVFIMLDHADAKTDEEKRALYVAITRAKNGLVIHTNGSEFDGLDADGLRQQIDENIYAPPRQLAVQATLRDVWLDFFITRQSLINDLVSGDAIIAKADGCCNEKGAYVLKFSKAFTETILDKEKKGYRLSHATVGHVIYWKKEGEEEECKVVVPEVEFERGE